MKFASYLLGALVVAVSAVYAQDAQKYSYCVNDVCASEPVDCSDLGTSFESAQVTNEDDEQCYECCKLK
ncbi:uncharacterized protein N7511_009967 [Penicillium nucicola]|uniref:uncharacterized protein n=1 Tax=Penicillium nucicola TaxID=1850975 RepID=UPI00254566EB|nr:uncharacterized protein N7511_009967 [Penicillium nucicola]KAJ5748271.1 hypothetical protein N7511_009967 [Penicillium nucicola]